MGGGVKWYVVLGCVCVLMLVGANSEWCCMGGSGGSIMGNRNYEVWFQVRFGRGVPHLGEMVLGEVARKH